jgi:hypothetical protein
VVVAMAFAAGVWALLRRKNEPANSKKLEEALCSRQVM